MTETDLARAMVAPVDRRKSLVRAATSGTGYNLYKGIRDNFGGILNLALNAHVAAPKATKQQILAAVARDCISPDDVSSNQSLAEGLCDYVSEHQVVAAEFDYHAVTLGRAGARRFWAPYLLRIDGKKFIPFFDFRQEERRLPLEACRVIFSIDHAHIRLADEARFNDIGFVVFQFDAERRDVRKATPIFDDRSSYWNATEIGAMVDDVYRVIDEIKRAA